MVFVAGLRCKLSPNQTVIVHILLKHQYEWVHKDQLMAAIYGGTEQPLTNVLSVAMTHIRRRFRAAELPLSIECNWHRYRIYHAEPKEQ
jgi:DNA-binding response OmpR family regulator